MKPDENPNKNKEIIEDDKALSDNGEK